MNPTHEERIESLIRIASRLIGVLNQEVALLRDMRVGELASLRAEKGELTVAYEQGVRALAAEPEALEALEPALREALSEVAVRFDGALAENARAIQAVRDSHDRLLKAIVDAVAEKRAREKAYGASGKFDAPVRSTRARGVSLTFDRRL